MLICIARLIPYFLLQPLRSHKEKKKNQWFLAYINFFVFRAGIKTLTATVYIQFVCLPLGFCVNILAEHRNLKLVTLLNRIIL